MALPTECRLCRASQEEQRVTTRHIYGGSNGRAFFRCDRCGVHYMYPPIAEEDEQRLYAEEFEKFMERRAGTGSGWQDPAEHVRANADHVTRRMRYLRGILPPSPAGICEIGCSSGFMLSPLRETGYDVFGVEPSRVFGKFLTQQRLAFVDDLDQLFLRGAPTRTFDVVMHFFVLEHIRHPAAFIARTLQLLNPGGVLVMEIPSAADPLVTVYDIPAFERFYWSLAHHWYFTEPALRCLLDQVGCRYEILVDQRYDLSNHLVWAMTGRAGGMKRFSEIFGEAFDEQYKRLWIERRQCDTMIAVVRKERER